MADDVFTQTKGNEESALQALVGEGKKFADAELLAKGKQEADAHITKLEEEAATRGAEMDALKTQQGTEVTIAELLKAVKESQTEAGSEEGKQLSNDELVALIKSVTEGETVASTKAANRAEGNKLVLAKAQGDVVVAKSLVAAAAKANGLTTDAMAKLSEESPQAFAKLMEVETSITPAGTQGLDNVNTSVLDGSTGVTEIDGHKTKRYFDAKRKEMGNVKYLYDTGLQRQMQEASQELGERFYQ